MNAKHRFLAAEVSSQGYVIVKGREVKHARKVLRLGVGDPVIVFDNEGNEFQGEIEKFFSKEEMKVRIVKELEREVVPTKNVHLVMSLCRSKNFELALQKCTEIGIASIIPVKTQRSILKKDRAMKKTERWGKIALDAAKQSTRISIPEIVKPHTYKEFLDSYDLNSDNSVIAAVSEKQKTFKDISSRFVDQKDIFLIIGPEGGFTEEEVSLAEGKGVNIVTLGKRVLRAETAAIFLTSVVFFELDL